MTVALGFCGHNTFARQPFRGDFEKPNIVQALYAAHRERVQLGMLGHDRPEPPESPSLLQQLLDIHLLVDVSSGCQQHQSLLALRRQVSAVPAASTPSPTSGVPGKVSEGVSKCK